MHTLLTSPREANPRCLPSIILFINIDGPYTQSQGSSRPRGGEEEEEKTLHSWGGEEPTTQSPAVPRERQATPLRARTRAKDGACGGQGALQKEAALTHLRCRRVS